MIQIKGRINRNRLDRSKGSRAQRVGNNKNREPKAKLIPMENPMQGKGRLKICRVKATKVHLKNQRPRIRAKVMTKIPSLVMEAKAILPKIK
jgi:hypothetical protein